MDDMEREIEERRWELGGLLGLGDTVTAFSYP